MEQPAGRSLPAPSHWRKRRRRWNRRTGYAMDRNAVLFEHFENAGVRDAAGKAAA